MQALFIQTCQQFKKPYLIGLTTSLREHSSHSFLFKHFSTQHITETREPTPVLLPQLLECTLHSNRFTTFIPKAVTFSPLVTHFWYIYLPSAGISRVCWHKWLHSSWGSSPTRRVCLGSFGVCIAQTSQAAGLGSASHRSIFQSRGSQICFNTSV